MASSSYSSSSPLVVQQLDHHRNSLSYPLIDLPNDYYQSLWKLVDHIKSIIAANEKHHGRKCEEFYIGKSTIHAQSGRHFDPDNSDTWNIEFIRKRWDARRERGYQAMAVLTVVTKDTLPPLKSRRPAQWKQQYTIALEQALITHFMFVEDDDRLANKTTEPGNLEKSGAIGYVLYLGMKFWPKWVVPLYELSFFFIQLPNHYSKSLSKLVDHIESIIEANEKYHGRKCEGFYIGKSTIRKQRGEKFDPNDQDTWDTKLIEDRWTSRKDDGYEAMAVLTVVTKKTLPPDEAQDSAEQYTLDLKKDLIKHFRDEEDERLKNKSTAPGASSSRGVAYVLYLAMKFEDDESSSENSSDSESETVKVLYY